MDACLSVPHKVCLWMFVPDLDQKNMGSRLRSMSSKYKQMDYLTTCYKCFLFLFIPEGGTFNTALLTIY